MPPEVAPLAAQDVMMTADTHVARERTHWHPTVAYDAWIRPGKQSGPSDSHTLLDDFIVPQSAPRMRAFSDDASLCIDLTESSLSGNTA